MAETLSTMLPLGTSLPPFTLRDAVTGKDVSVSAASGTKGTLVMFICIHCPFVQHVLPEISRLAREYAEKGFAIFAVNSNDLEAYPQDGPPHMKELANAQGWTFPFLIDETQEVAKTFQAACTPDFFLFDAAGKLAYRGRLDETRPKSGNAPHGRDLRAALDSVAGGRQPEGEQHPSVGCNIKWKAAAV
jgi:thiol-disulfide isomerase/thioredoxin